MTDISVRYQMLNKGGRKQLEDFLDFLLHCQALQQANAMAAYKTKILKVSTWADQDLKEFDENKDKFNSSWQAEQW